MKARIEDALKGSLDSFGEASRLKEAVSYALLSPGKRFRPMLVLLVAEALGRGKVPMHAALSVEFFHTASLVADDLPCMDNDAMRRGQESVHARFGETTALLASYALITAAFEQVALEAKGWDGEVCRIALENAGRLSGIRGATGGQFYDLFPPPLSLEAIEHVHYLKTGTLFEVSFLFGWLFGGGEVERLDEVKRCAYHFGFAFQIADDLRDFDEDEFNFAQFSGKEMAFKRFEEEVLAYEGIRKNLGLASEAFDAIDLKLRERAALVHSLHE